jgi:hypothetical protein
MQRSNRSRRSLVFLKLAKSCRLDAPRQRQPVLSYEVAIVENVRSTRMNRSLILRSQTALRSSGPSPAGSGIALLAALRLLTHLDRAALAAYCNAYALDALDDIPSTAP